MLLAVTYLTLVKAPKSHFPRCFNKSPSFLCATKTRSSGREARIRVLFFPVVYFSRGTLPPKGQQDWTTGRPKSETELRKCAAQAQWLFQSINSLRESIQHFSPAPGGPVQAITRSAALSAWLTLEGEQQIKLELSGFGFQPQKTTAEIGKNVSQQRS